MPVVTQGMPDWLDDSVAELARNPHSDLAAALAEAVEINPALLDTLSAATRSAQAADRASDAAESAQESAKSASAAAEGFVDLLGTKLDTAEASSRFRGLESAADPLAYLSRIKHVLTLPARPAGTLLWPQGIAVNLEDGHVYVGYNGTVGTPAVSTQRIAVYTLEGRQVSQRDVPIEGGTSSEGLPYWRNAEGQLCFLLRPAAGGQGYAILNYDTGLLGPVIPLPGGNYKSAVSGDYLYTVDSNDSINGFSRLFVYSLASMIKAGTPELVQTVVLSSRNRMEKVQSFTVNGDMAIFNHGASKSQVYLSAYSLSGGLQTAFELDKRSFAEAINAGAPGTIANPASYRHEGEGACTVGGRAWTGHVVDDNNTTYKLVLVEHNRPDGVSVSRLPVLMALDDDWTPLSLREPAVAYTVGATPRFRVDGKQTFVEGAVKGLAGAPADTVVGNLGTDAAPSRQLELPLMGSSGGGNAAWKIRPNGDLIISRTSVASPGPTTWYPFTFNWVCG